ncbi:NAD-dependent protein deacylase Sir2 [Austwickia sp. TVS 96-490-7B]|nr:NAD-dependent protein deacylase Sir2 [Austwickia sp. TVS 96-490-7B]
MAVPVPDAVVEYARHASRIVVLTGAGMSDESGVPTFRDAHTGLWELHDPDRLVTAEAWAEEPELVFGWHWWLAQLVRRCHPHDGHLALARWAQRIPVDIITQNVDDLHERAGSAVAAHLHGTLLTFSCGDCGAAFPLDVPPMSAADAASHVVPTRMDPPVCPHCDGDVRPDVVLFGEQLPVGAFDVAVDAMLAAELCLVVGTSGIVQPAGSLPDIARGHGVPVVEINPQETALSWGVDVCWRQPAGRALPALLAAVEGDQLTTDR